MNSKLLQETYCLRRKYYLFKQYVFDYQNKLRDFEIRMLNLLLEFPDKKEHFDSMLKTYKESLSEMFQELKNMKDELSKLPNIPNKSERKKIRQLKAKRK